MTTKLRRELIPPDAANADDAMEIVRVWVAEGSQHVALRPDIWKDPAAWGLMLVDLARHVANAYEPDARDAILTRIKVGFDMEWAHPTDSPRQVEK